MQTAGAEREGREERLRRLRLRSARRGTREMDLILGPFAEHELAGIDDADLDAFESLLSKNDHDLYGWIAGRSSIPEEFSGIVGRIRRRLGLD